MTNDPIEQAEHAFQVVIDKLPDEADKSRLAELKDGIVADLKALEGQPVEQAKYLADAIETVIGLQSVYAEKRREILQQMRETKSAAEIAEEMGISRARVYQILRGQ